MNNALPATPTALAGIAGSAVARCPTALRGIDFLAELGHADNRAVAAPVDAAYLARLEWVLDDLLSGV